MEYGIVAEMGDRRSHRRIGKAACSVGAIELRHLMWV